MNSAFQDTAFQVSAFQMAGSAPPPLIIPMGSGFATSRSRSKDDDDVLAFMAENDLI